jgi:UDP-GlcNAc3NAcA epimerase
MKVLSVFGARPQFVKSYALSRVFSGKKGLLKEVNIHTGQHYDQKMSDAFFSSMGLPKPDYFLGVGGLSHGAMSGRMLEKIEEILIKEKPNCTVVYGDTNSTLAGALASVKLHIPVVHIEAGLRSFNRRMPEEINRVLTDHCSSLLFAPTPTAVRNLRNEGIPEDKIQLVGDVMYDVSMHLRQTAESNSSILEQYSLTPANYVLATIHRQENTDAPDRLKEICSGLEEIAKKQTLVWPIHPRTKKILEESDFWDLNKSNIQIIDPVDYLDMLMLISNAGLIATDSGGLQKEAYFFKVPCLTLRDETEWVELVENGFNILVGADKRKILESYEEMLIKKNDWSTTLYGDGKVGEKIVKELLDRYQVV